MTTFIPTLPKEILSEMVVRGHFIYRSGKHGSVYINKNRLYAQPHLTRQVGQNIANRFITDDIHVVTGTITGGAILAQWVGLALTEYRNKVVYAVYADKSPCGTPIFKRGYEWYLAGQNVLIVDDVLTTGTTISRLIGATEKTGGKVCGVGVICDRRHDTTHPATPYPIHAIWQYPQAVWDPDQCPLCRQKVPFSANYHSDT